MLLLIEDGLENECVAGPVSYILWILTTVKEKHFRKNHAKMFTRLVAPLGAETRGMYVSIYILT